MSEQPNGLVAGVDRMTQCLIDIPIPTVDVVGALAEHAVLSMTSHIFIRVSLVLIMVAYLDPQENFIGGEGRGETRDAVVIVLAVGLGCGAGRQDNHCQEGDSKCNKAIGRQGAPPKLPS